MAKVLCCDICKKDGKLTETNKYISVRGKPDLRLDHCPKCKSKIPQNMTKYVIFVYDLHGIKLTESEAKKMLQR